MGSRDESEHMAHLSGWGPAGRRAAARRDARGESTLPSNGDLQEPQLRPRRPLSAQGPPQPAPRDAEARYTAARAALNVHLLGVLPAVGRKVGRPCLSMTSPDSLTQTLGTLALEPQVHFGLDFENQRLKSDYSRNNDLATVIFWIK